MIDIRHLVENTDLYAAELDKRGKDPIIAAIAKEKYMKWKDVRAELDLIRKKKNDFNKKVISLSGNDRLEAISEMKESDITADQLVEKERELLSQLDDMLSKVPSISSDKTPIGKSDKDNVVIESWNTNKKYDFELKPYYDLAVYKKYVDSDTGAKVMGARGYYMRGEIQRLQKALFRFAEDIILKNNFEEFYVPLMLNEKVMTDIGNLPDFDGQLYQVPINESTDYYLIPSSEQPLMSYFAAKKLGKLEDPILVFANTTCFRKESGSYGKDQQGILRVHQFEKMEMDALCKPEDNDKVFDLFGKINEEIYNSLGLDFRAVEVCTGDMPNKHYRQIDYEANFPAVDKYREICSNGSASDYQSRGLKTTYTNSDGEKSFAYSLNCTGLTFRTGLALMEQFQTADGRVKIPKVLVPYFGKDYLE